MTGEDVREAVFKSSDDDVAGLEVDCRFIRNL
jgi:hypothetical protein